MQATFVQAAASPIGIDDMPAARDTRVRINSTALVCKPGPLHIFPTAPLAASECGKRADTRCATVLTERAGGLPG